MPEHKFQVGQTVFLHPLPPNMPGGAFVVTQRLPERDGDRNRIKSATEPHANLQADQWGIAIISRIAKLLAFVVISLTLSGCGYNTIPTLQEQAKARWSDVQNQYQRRADLIPNLVATVQGYAAQEKNVLTAVVEARAKATQITVNASDLTDPDKLKTFQEAQAQLSSALGRLLAVTENYPDLKSNANFLALQSQLEGTENRIAVARRDYIDAVRAYNTALRTFPTVIWAKTAFSGEKPMAEFTANEGTQTPPQVKF